MSLSRRQYIELIRRQIYGGFPPEQAEITEGLVNKLLDVAIGVAAKQCYTDNLKIEGIASVNSGFYTTFTGLSVTQSGNDNFLWKIELPDVPPGIGNNEGVSTVKFVSPTGEVSQPVVWLSQNQLSYHNNMRDIPNKLIGYYQGRYVYVFSTIQLSQYDAIATVISGGLPSDMNSILNVPPDYLTIVTDYIQKQLGFERSQPVQGAQDGVDGINVIA